VLGDGHVSVKTPRLSATFLSPRKISSLLERNPSARWKLLYPPPPPPNKKQNKKNTSPDAANSTKIPLLKIPKDRKPLMRLSLLALQILHLLTSILIVLVMSLLIQTLVVLAQDRVDVMIVYKTSAPVNILLPLGIACVLIILVLSRPNCTSSKRI
jgi:hypothetical protein